MPVHPVFVGRLHELATLNRLGENVQSGSGGVVVVVGEAGMGKSALVEEAFPTARTCIGRAAVPPALPLVPIVELVSALVGRGADLSSAVLGPYRPALVALLPDLAGAGVRERSLETPHPTVLGEAVLRLWSTLAVPDRPLLLLEDVHWSDGQTWAVLDTMARRAGGWGTGMLITTRPEGASWDGVQRLTDDRAVTCVELMPLATPEVGLLVASFLGAQPAALPPGLLEQVASAGGVPLLVEHVLDELTTSSALVETSDGWQLGAVRVRLPATLASTTWNKLAAMAPAERQLVEMGAVVGRRLETDLLAQATGLGLDSLVEATEAAVAARLVEVERGSGTPVFRHELLREAVLAGLLDLQRRRYAEILLTGLGCPLDGSRDIGWTLHLTDERLTLAARLAGESARTDLAGVLHLAAARRLLDRGLPLAAVSAAESAVAASPRDAGIMADALAVLVQARALAGDVDGARDGVNRLLALPGVAVPALVGESMARATAMKGRWEEAAQRLTELRGPDEPATTTALAALVALETGRYDAALLDARRVLAGGVEGAPACEAMEVLGRLARRSDLEEAASWFQRAVAMAELNGLVLWRARALHEAATIDQLRTLDTSAMVLAREAAVAAGAPGLVTAVDFHLSATFGVRFEPAPALVAGRRLLMDARSLGASRQEAWAWILIGQAHAVAGERTRAALSADEARACLPGDPEIEGLAAGLCSGLPALLDEDLTTAQESHRVAVRWLRELPSPTALPPWYLWSILATVLDLEGDGGRRARAEAAGSDLRVATGPDGLWHLANAVAEGRDGRVEAAQAASDRAMARFSAVPRFAGWQHLGLRWVADEARIAGWGDPAAWMTDAETWFGDHGFGRVASACRGLARRAGAPQRRTGRGSTAVPPHLKVVGVTPREVDVLRLVADGLTNAEIASRLYLSPRTVKGYVEQLLAKTHASNRTMLATRLEAPTA